MRKRVRSIALLLSILAIGLLFAPLVVLASDEVFGPVTCQRGTGAPAVVNYSFNASDPARGFVFKVYNGGLEDTNYEMVSSSTVTLNGVQILGQSNFNQNVSFLEVPVILQGQNTLNVEVLGKPGGALVIKIFPLVTIDTPASGQVVSATSVTVTGHLYSDVAGVNVNGVAGTVTGTTFSVSGIPLVEGANVFTATAVRADGFSGQSSITVFRDKTPPAIMVSSPQDGATVSAPSIDILGSVDDPAAVVHINGAAVQLTGTSFSASGISLQLGVNEIPIEATDPLGNTSTTVLHVTYAPPPPTATLSATPSQLQIGSESTLQWTTSWATDVSISPGIGAVATVGTLTVSPTATTTYSLTATGPGGTATVETTVTVTYPAPSVSLTAAPGTILEGSSATLTWTATNATACSIEPGVGLVPVSGSSSVTPTAATTYTISCSGAGGSATAATTVSVDYLPPTTVLSAEPTSVMQGGSSTLSWISSHAESCAVDNGIGSVPCAGSVAVAPNATTTFVMTAVGPGGTATSQVTLVVTYPAPTITISASHTEILRGASTTLSWSSTGADSCSIDQGIGAVGGAGTQTVNPLVTTIYIITATGPGGTKTAQVQVTVQVPAPTATIAATPSEVAPGAPSTLRWTTTDAQSCSLDNGIGAVACSGSMDVTPASTTTYTITATGPSGSAFAQITVTAGNAPTITLSGYLTQLDEWTTITTLTWSSTNADYCLIEGLEDQLPPSGTFSGYDDFEVSKTYRMTAVGPGGTATAEVFLVKLPPPTVSILSSPSSIAAGATSVLSWECSNATSCEINQGIGAVPLSGSMTVSPTSTTIYTITATGPGVSATASTAVFVAAVPTASLSAMPSSVPPGEASVLTWATTNAGSCSIAPGVGMVPCNGTIQVRPTSTTVYTLYASGSTATTNAQATVTVAYPAPAVTISASSTAIQLGGSVTLSWAAANAWSVSIDQGIGVVTATGTRSISPSATTTYTATASGPGGTSSAQVTVVVTYPEPTVTISALPSVIMPGDSSILSWSSTDADVCYVDQGIGAVATSGAINVNPGVTTTYTITATGRGGSAQATVTVTYSPPSVSLTATPDTIILGATSTLAWNSTAADTCSIDNGIGTVPCLGTLSVSPSVSTTYTLSVSGPGGSSASSVSIRVETGGLEAQISASMETIQLGQTTTISWQTNVATQVIIEPELGVVARDGSADVSPTASTIYRITAVGPDGVATATVRVEVLGSVAPLPAGSFGEQYQDLVPADATLASYDTRRFALVTGLVQDRTHLPLVGVSVTVHGKPEYGTAVTDAEGRFTLPVEGGGAPTLVFRKEGFVTSHRMVEVGWNDIAAAETVVMIPEDPHVTTIRLDGNPQSSFVHRGTPVVDEFGSRAATMVLAGDTRAFAQTGAGEVEIAQFDLRATEFDIPEAMPAKLPPASAYTYCADLTAVGLEQVRFSKPAVMYVENFLGFPVGEIVPVGSYDYQTAQWTAAENGKVVRLLDLDNDGVTDALDATGDGLPDDLDGDGVNTDEAGGLESSANYPPGATFWRAMIIHLSPWDLNWPFGFGPLDIGPNFLGMAVSHEKRPKDKFACLNSYAEETGRIYHDDLAIPGTSMTLHYASDRVTGYLTRIDVPASGHSVPATLKNIIVRVSLAGRVLETTLHAAPDQIATFTWDGKDHLGRPVFGTVVARVEIGFVYPAYYYGARMASDGSSGGNAFGGVGRFSLDMQTRSEVVSWAFYDLEVHRRPTSEGLAEGWTLSEHHQNSPADPSILLKGDGTVVQQNLLTHSTAAGQFFYDAYGSCGSGEFCNPQGIAFDAAGNMYVADSGHSRVAVVDRQGVVRTFAGTRVAGFSGDGGPATAARLMSPNAVAVDAAGNVYIADAGAQRIRKVDTRGIITTVAGNGQTGYDGEDMPALQTRLSLAATAQMLAVDASGNVYFIDNTNLVRKVSPDGLIARAWSAYHPQSLTVDAAGNLFILEMGNHRVYKLDTTGKSTLVAGTYAAWGNNTGDGGPAVNAQLSGPESILLDRAGNLFVLCYPNLVRVVDPGGMIRTYVAYNPNDHSYGLSGLAVDNAGALHISDRRIQVIRKVSTPGSRHRLAGVGDQFFTDSGLGFEFSGSLHTATWDLATGSCLYTFGYDNRRLVSMTDRHGNTLTIRRDSSGTPVALVSPDGQLTGLAVDAARRLREAIYPDGSLYRMEYDNHGLMTDKWDPRGNHFVHQFDATGRVARVEDPEGGDWSWTHLVDETGKVFTTVRSAEGEEAAYEEQYQAGSYSSRATGPDGSVSVFTRNADGSVETSALGCGMTQSRAYALEPLWSYLYLKSVQEWTPGGLSRGSAVSRLYADTNADAVNDRITDSISVNGRITTQVTETLTGTVTQTTPAGRQSTLRYDPATLLTQEIALPGLTPATYGYDSRGRMTSAVVGSRMLQIAYDQNGNPDYLVTPDDKTFDYSYDIMGRLLAESHPDGSEVDYQYDANGNLTALVNPNAVPYAFGYTANNQRRSLAAPLSGTYQYLYDRDRRLKTVTFPSGRQIVNAYAAGVLDYTVTPEGTIDYDYACSARLTHAARGGEGVSFTYDGTFVTSDTRAGTLSKSIGYTYNNDFALATMSYAGVSVGFGYDADGLLTSADGYTIARSAQNGLPLVVSGNGLTQGRTFSGYGEVDGSAWTVGAGSPYQWNVTRDAAGRIVQRTEVIDGETVNWEYAFDTLGRLTAVQRNSALVESYSYDANGNRLNEMNSLRGIMDRSYTHSVEDHILAAGADSYVFDVDGFLQSKAGAEGTTVYDYSSRGELQRVDLPDGGIVTYLNDPFGRRIAKQINGTTVEKYLWAGQTTLLAVYDGNDNLLQRYTYADARMPVSMTAGSATYFLLTDQVGTLRAVADSTGTLVKRIDYDSFGNIINDTNPGFSVPFGFAGGLHDRDTGLVRFGYRDYSPELGRFVAKDPIDFAGGDTNLYAYVSNDPVNFIDPWGLKPGDVFPTIQQTAIDAINYIRPTSAAESREYGGWIERVPGGYTYGEPTPGGPTGLKLPCEPPSSANAWYHTHPAVAGRRGEDFSGGDRYVAREGDDIAYLGTPSGVIRRFVPGPRGGFTTTIVPR